MTKLITVIPEFVKDECQGLCDAEISSWEYELVRDINQAVTKAAQREPVVGILEKPRKLEIEMLLAVKAKIGLSWSLSSRLWIIQAYEIPREAVVFVGMKNLDELRVARPFALVTVLPWVAAAAGIYLGTRMHKPKGLAEVPVKDLPNLETRTAVDLFIENLRVVYNACKTK